MKRILAAVLLLPAAVQAGTDLVFDSIKLNELAKVGFNQIAKTDYIADHEFNQEEKTVSVYLKDRSPDEIRATLVDLVEMNGYRVTASSSGGLLISKKNPADTEQKTPFYYKPRHRSTQYLIDMLSPIFDASHFTVTRSVGEPASQKQTDTVDTGTSAFSLMSKNYDALIFHATPAKVEQFRELVQQIDVASEEIQVKAMIFEVTETEGHSSSFEAALSLLNGKFTLQLAAQKLQNFVGFKTGDVTAIFSALSSDSRFKVVSSPSLRVKDRHRAVFTVGAEVPVLSAVTLQQNGLTTQSVDYVPSGVILDIYPTIRGQDIELEIKQQLSNFVATSTGVNNSPTLLKRELSTVVNASHDEIIILGGLEENTDSSSKSGISFLPDFLQSKSSDRTRADILLVLHVQKL